MGDSQRSLMGKQPARVLVFDLSAPLTIEVGEDVCMVLENLFTLACNFSGPTRIPFFSLMTLGSDSEIVLPISYVRNNFPRIQKAINDVRDKIRDIVSLESTPCTSYYNVLAEACSQYRRQLQSTLQTGGFCHQLEIVIVSCQKEKLVQKYIETAISTLDTEHLKRIQVLCLSTDSLDDVMVSQSSVMSDNSSTNSCSNAGLVEMLAILPDLLCLQNFFNRWLVDSGTDFEHMHLLLPPLVQGVAMEIKCDLHERVLQTAQLPFFSQFTLHADASCMKVVFPSTSKAMGIMVPVFKLQVTSRVPILAICDSIVFGMPMVAQATSCWKIDWDDLARNQQMFKALCHSLLQKEHALIAQLLPNKPVDNTKTSKTAAQPPSQPCGHFVLVPSSNGTLLVKAIAVQELMLPYNVCPQNGEPSQDCLEYINESLEQIECIESYNPLQHTSNLYESLRNLNKKPPVQRQPQKRPVPENAGNYSNKMSYKAGKQIKKPAVVKPSTTAIDTDTPFAKRILSKVDGQKCPRRTLYTEPHTMFTLDDDVQIVEEPATNYHGKRQSFKPASSLTHDEPRLSFPTHL